VADAVEGVGQCQHKERTSLEHPRLDWHLDNWARYMRERDVDELECKNIDIWQAGHSDFDTMADAMERRCAVAFDSLVSDLPIAERVAVHHMHLDAVWRVNRPGMTIEAVYQQARETLSDGLRRKGIS